MSVHATGTKSASPDINRPDRMAVLATALLRRGHRAAPVDRIVGGNFHRVFREAAG
jgi:microsomal dipeptidase-like Zn-dependent dipeptidase